jgi:hypothetical protein
MMKLGRTLAIVLTLVGLAAHAAAQPTPKDKDKTKGSAPFTEYDCAGQVISLGGQLSFAPIVSGNGGVGATGEFGITPGIVLQPGIYQVLLNASRLTIATPPPPAGIARLGGQLTVVLDNPNLPVVQGRWLMMVGLAATAGVAVSQLVQVSGPNEILRFRHTDPFADQFPGTVVWGMRIGESCRLILTKLE